MKRIYGILALALIATLAFAAFAWFPKGISNNPPLKTVAQEDLYELAQRLENMHGPIGPTRSGDWLKSHQEFGQTFAQYANSRYVRISDERNVLYVLPLGDFNLLQMKVVELSAEFLKRYFVCEVVVLPVQDLSVIPEKARRTHSSWGMRQINSQYVLDEVLPEMLPDDAVALIAFSSIDLYPQDDWNFVFGQASLHGRVGVWSIYRNGDLRTEFTKALLRTLKTASHETGHMFSIKHCIAYNCNMCGSNSQEESDRRPVHVCPECVAKIWLATGCDPVERFKGLKEFCEENRLPDEAEFYQNSIEAIEK